MWLRREGTGPALTRPLQQYQVGVLMEHMGMDILGPFPITDQGNRYILMAMDYLQKWPELYVVPGQSAATTAERLVNDMFCRFGVPEELHSDQPHHCIPRVTDW